MFKIGIIADSFKYGFVENIKKASALGAQGVQLYATDGELAPENLTSAKISEIKDIIRSNGLEVSAICGDLGGHGFAVSEENEWKIEKSKRILDLARKLDCKIVTTHIGVVPQDENSLCREVMRKACQELADFATDYGAYFAVETGPEPAIVLKEFLDSLTSKGISVNFDPANFVMVTGDDVVSAVNILKDYIVHTHAKDGIMLKKTDPKVIYDILAQGGIGDLGLGNYFIEVPLGEGKVDFDSYISALSNIGYKGYLTIEREVGENPERDIKIAVDFLNEKIKKYL